MGLTNAQVLLLRLGITGLIGYQAVIAYSFQLFPPYVGYMTGMLPIYFIVSYAAVIGVFDNNKKRRKSK